MGVEKEVYLNRCASYIHDDAYIICYNVDPWEYRKSSSQIEPLSDENGVNLEVGLGTWVDGEANLGIGRYYDPSDSYTTAYAKRVNYWVRESNGDVLTQGTMYVCSATDYIRYYTAYTMRVPFGYASDVKYSLFLDTPTGKGCAAGRISTSMNA